jgi:hypothetical protein
MKTKYMTVFEKLPLKIMRFKIKGKKGLIHRIIYVKEKQNEA